MVKLEVVDLSKSDSEKSEKKNKEPIEATVFNDGDYREIPLSEALGMVKKMDISYLRKDDVKKGGIVSLTVKDVGKAYIRRFGDREVLRLDLTVEVSKANDSDYVGKQYTWTIGKSNLKKLVDLFGDNPDNWKGKELFIHIVGEGDFQYIEIINDILNKIKQ